MESVADSNNLEFHQDVKKLTVGSVQTFFKYLELNPNATLYSIVWCVDEWDVKYLGNEANIPCKFGDQATKDGKELIIYTIWYNNSLQENHLFRPIHEPMAKN
jgi:hypothetical protein